MDLTAFLSNNISIHGEQLEVNRAARWLIMSSYLYYHRSCNVLSDGDYDKLSNFVADNWDELTEQMKWQLNSPDDIRATGNGIILTQMGEDGAIAWYRKHNKNVIMEGHKVGRWLGPHEKFKCLYSVISG